MIPISWTAPKTYSVGEVLTAATMNTHVRDNLLQTAPAKAAAAGDTFYATAANVIAPLGIGTALQNYRTNAGATAPEWFTQSSAITLEGSNNTEATSASTSMADRLSVTGLSIAAARALLITVNWRKTSGAGANAVFEIKLNSTVITGSIITTNSTDEAQSGIIVLYLGSRVTNYLRSGFLIHTRLQAGVPAVTLATEPSIDAPTATITDVVIRGQSGSGSVTHGLDELRVYSLG